MLINSEYKVASDAVNNQIDALNAILKSYDEGGMLIGEAPCMKDMIETTNHDFEVVNAVSIVAIFVIIALVEKSISLPFILIAVIELAIFINLGLPHYLGQSLPFIAPICISTIQLGATVYSDIDIISSMCMLMARGAVVSMLAVIFILPALLLLCDKLICYTTIGMKKAEQKDTVTTI